MNTPADPPAVVIATRRRLRCPSCVLARINGAVCHETGCPSRHLFTRPECAECGRAFRPARVGQVCCSGSCRRAYGR